MAKKSKPIRKVLVISDTHCGSKLGLCPPNATSVEGDPISQSAENAWVWERWCEFQTQWLPDIIKGDPYALVLNGDLIEGVHHGGSQVLSNQPADHFLIASLALEPVAAKAAKVFVILGTETHTGAHSEHQMAYMLGAEPNGKRHAWPELNLQVHGCSCKFVHHMPTSAVDWTRGGGLSRQRAAAQLEAARHGETVPKVVVGGHRHIFDCLTDQWGMSIACPPWQVKTRYAEKVATHSRSTVGGVVLDWSGKAEGELPQVHARTWAAALPPEIKL